jgi:hypothetical protein
VATGVAVAFTAFQLVLRTDYGERDHVFKPVRIYYIYIHYIYTLYIYVYVRACVCVGVCALMFVCACRVRDVGAAVNRLVGWSNGRSSSREAACLPCLFLSPQPCLLQPPPVAIISPPTRNQNKHQTPDPAMVHGTAGRVAGRGQRDRAAAQGPHAVLGGAPAGKGPAGGGAAEAGG